MRLAMGAGNATPVIDNVAVEAIPLPEPGAMLQLAAGMAGLFALSRLRR